MINPSQKNIIDTQNIHQNTVKIDAHNYCQNTVNADLSQFINKDIFSELVIDLNYCLDVSIREVEPYNTTLSNKNILHLVHEADRFIRSECEEYSDLAIRVYKRVRNLFPAKENIKMGIQAPKFYSPKKAMKTKALIAERFGEGILLSKDLDNIFERPCPNPKVDRDSSFNIDQPEESMKRDPSCINSMIVCGGLKCGTEIHRTIANEEYSSVRYILKEYSHHIDATIVDEEKKTILITACKANAPLEVINDILTSKFKTKLNVNAKDLHDATALHYASLYGRVDIVKSLIEHGASLKIVDNKNRSSLDYANKNDEFIKKKLEAISIDGRRDVRAESNCIRKVNVSLLYEGILLSQPNIDKMIQTIENDPDHYDRAQLGELKKLRKQLSGKSLISHCREGQKEVREYLHKERF